MLAQFRRFVLPLAACASLTAFAQKRDVVYGYKDGTALVLDVFTPARLNGAGVLQLISGGMRSNLTASRPRQVRRQTQTLLDAGYTVFAVFHGSQPRYTVPEISQDIARAVRFVRYNAAGFGVHPERLGMFGFSSGGHLALYAGTTGKPGVPEARDPVDGASSRLQAVAAYYPSSDFLNFGREGVTIIEGFRSRPQFRPAFDFRELSRETSLLERISGEQRIREILRECSPATHVSADDPPFLLFHGDGDKLIPIQQSRHFAALLERAGVEHRLVVREGQGHGWEPDAAELAEFRGWFDGHLLKNGSSR
jgi:acetyl esterase/lipase